MIERDYSAELARIAARLADAKQTRRQTVPSDRLLAWQLTAQLDAMLTELRGPRPGIRGLASRRPS